MSSNDGSTMALWVHVGTARDTHVGFALVVVEVASVVEVDSEVSIGDVVT